MMQRLRPILAVIGWLTVGWGTLFVVAAQVTSDSDDVAILLRADKNGVEQENAASAWDRIVARGPASLPALLEAASRANPVALNWIVTAADYIVDVERANSRKIPDAVFLSVVENRAAQPKIRWWAWQRLDEQSPELAAKILEASLDDPAPQLRRAAVEAAIQKLGDLDSFLSRVEDADVRRTVAAQLERIFEAARDRDQVEKIAGWLEQLEKPVDLAAHYGYVRSWLVVGPFENTGDSGFDTAFPPETTLDPHQKYPGKHGEVTWKVVTIDDVHGRVDLNAILGEEKGVTAYAWAVIEVEKEQPAEIRWATPNATKLWLNGQLLAVFHVYHSGYEDDQYRVECRLKPGKNQLLLKICQNEQTQDWARPWEFRLRVCDALGGGVGRVATIALPANHKK
jgi:hypothetical protein